MKLSIVIPIYNEETTLEVVLEAVQNAELPKQFKSRELILVDDCSKDGTRKILKQLKYKNIKTLLHKKNMGKGKSVSDGLKMVTGDVVIIQDADLEYNPSDYMHLLDPIAEGKADIVIGSRYVQAQCRRVEKFWHTLGNKLFTIFSNMMSDIRLTDSYTCYKAFTKEVAKNLKITENRFGIEAEIVAQMAEMKRNQGKSIFEVRIDYNPRTYDEGKNIKLRDLFRGVWCVVKYNTSPFAVFCKYMFNGIVVALSQFAVIIALVEVLSVSSPSGENIAYIISILTSLFVAFLLHSSLSWRYKFNSYKHWFKKLGMFYAVSMTSVVVRQIVFYALSIYGVDYKLNTLIGILIAIMINFAGYDKLVFKKRVHK